MSKYLVVYTDNEGNIFNGNCVYPAQFNVYNDVLTCKGDLPTQAELSTITDPKNFRYKFIILSLHRLAD